ncbi:MAG: AsmA family protein, partial [Bradyrhizobium sp.]|nr:AsmA family protein [Bradyrhizobium sp.]
AEALAGLKPAFPAIADYALDDKGTTYRGLILQRYPGLEIEFMHHAGNSSGVVDGAAALLLASPAYAKAHGLKPRARVVAMANMGDDPTLMLNAPVPATRKVLAKAGLTLDDIDLSLAWPSISRSFAATGQFDWRGQRIEGSISVSDFLAALSGDRSGLKMRLASPPLKVAFDGTVANRTSALMEGTLTVDSPSLREALRWTGQTPLGSGGFGRFALRARANVVGASIALTNVNVELDGNTAEGVMTYANNGRQALQATLAADALDFTPYISTVRLLANGARDWNRQLFDLKALSTTDLDMRLSAAKVTVGPSKLGRTAFGANLRNGVLALSVGEAQMYGGIVRGSVGIARADAVADVKAELQFADVDLQSCANELFGVSSISGRGNLNVSLTASGSSPFGLAQSLDGSATLQGRDGSISGFNVEQLLKRLERSPLSRGGNFRSGSTPYDSLTVAVRFSDGVATAEDIRVESPTARITMTGTASVPTREYDFKGVASLLSSGNGGNGFELPFVVQGPWE